MGLNIHVHTFPILGTERLILRQLAATDAQDSFLFLSDEETMRYYDSVQAIYMSLDFIYRFKGLFKEVLSGI